MDNAVIIKSLIVLLSLPWWLPLVRQVIQDVRAAAELDHAPPAWSKSADEQIEEQRVGWASERDPHGVRNHLWATGRAPVRRRTGFRR